MLAMGFVLVGRPCAESMLSSLAWAACHRQASAGSSLQAERTHLLVLPVVAGDSAMGCLSLDGLPIRTHQDRGHQPQ